MYLYLYETIPLINIKRIIFIKLNKFVKFKFLMIYVVNNNVLKFNLF